MKLTTKILKISRDHMGVFSLRGWESLVCWNIWNISSKNINGHKNIKTCCANFSENHWRLTQNWPSTDQQSVRITCHTVMWKKRFTGRAHLLEIFVGVAVLFKLYFHKTGHHHQSKFEKALKLFFAILGPCFKLMQVRWPSPKFFFNYETTCSTKTLEIL